MATSTSQRMSHADAAWLHMDQPTNLMVITGVLWFDQPPDWDGVRENDHGTAWSSASPAFASGWWREGPRSPGRIGRTTQEFDLDLHLHRVALPAPGDRDALQAFVADLMASPLDRSKPLWQFQLVDGYGEGAALVGRIHHCIADGIALGRVLLSLTDESPDAGIAPPDDERASSGRRGRPAGALLPPGRGRRAALRPRWRTRRSRWASIPRTCSTLRPADAPTPKRWGRSCSRAPIRRPP